MAENVTKTVKCPICRKDVPLDGPEMPFCSDRCRIIDLGNWASEKYVIPVPIDPKDFEDGSNEIE
jgi:endogenous inhibitor of DNA gyrase (YacG/DUF329 family)